MLCPLLLDLSNLNIALIHLCIFSLSFLNSGRALIALGEWDKAREDLVSAAKIQPNNVGIRLEIQKLDKKKKQFQEKERKQAAAMFA